MVRTIYCYLVYVKFFIVCVDFLLMLRVLGEINQVMVENIDSQRKYLVIFRLTSTGASSVLRILELFVNILYKYFPDSDGIQKVRFVLEFVQSWN